MNRKIMFSLVIIVMALGLVIGGTFAWFTAQDEVTNTFTAGTVLFDLSEVMESDSATDLLNAPNVNPGDCYNKKLTIVNEGTKYILLRMNFTENWLINVQFLLDNAETLGFTEAQVSGLGLLTLDVDGYATLEAVNNLTAFNLVNPVIWGDIEEQLETAGWIYNTAEEYWYYDSALAGTFDIDPNKIDTLIFDFDLCFDGAIMDNVFQASYYSLTIGVEAIQASNNASGDLWSVDSWYFENGASVAPDPNVNTTGENWSEWDPDELAMQYPAVPVP